MRQADSNCSAAGGHCNKGTCAAVAHCGIFGQQQLKLWLIVIVGFGVSWDLLTIGDIPAYQQILMRDYWINNIIYFNHFEHVCVDWTL